MFKFSNRALFLFKLQHARQVPNLLSSCPPPRVGAAWQRAEVEYFWTDFIQAASPTENMPKPLYLLISLLELFAVASTSSATLLVADWGIAPTTSEPGLEIAYDIAALQYEGNNVNFPSLNGTLVFPALCKELGVQYNLTNKLIAIEFEGYRVPHTETWLVAFAQLYNPKAVVVFGEEMEGREIGSIQPFKFGENTESVTFPVVHISYASYNALRAGMNASGLLCQVPQVSLDDTGSTYCADFVRWFGPFFVATHGCWIIGNFALATWVLVNRSAKMSFDIGALVIMMHMVGNLLRGLHTVDPFIGWLFPIPLMEMLMTMPIPFVISASILITLYWYDIMFDSSLTVFRFLSSTRYIAVIVVPILITSEIITGSLRAVYGPGDYQYLSAMIYLVVMVAVIIVYLAVSSVILRKLRMMVGAINFPTRKLRAATLRIMISGIGLLIALCTSILFVTPVAGPILGDSIARWILYISMNFICTTHIMVFRIPKRRRSSLSNSNSTKTGTGSSKANSK